MLLVLVLLWIRLGPKLLVLSQVAARLRLLLLILLRVQEHRGRQRHVRAGRTPNERWLRLRRCLAMRRRTAGLTIAAPLPIDDRSAHS